MKYVAKDGRIFDNEDKCLDYEKKLTSQVDEKEKDYKALIDKKKAYESAKKEYEEADRQFFNKYYREEQQQFVKLLDWMFN